MVSEVENKDLIHPVYSIDVGTPLHKADPQWRREFPGWPFSVLCLGHPV
jgi:hypothetical protein